RKKMLHLAIKNNPYFFIDDFEIRKSGKSFTIDTIKYFKKNYDNLFFLLGTDTFLSLHKWKNYKELVELTNFIVLLRGNDTIINIENYIKKFFPNKKLKKDNQINFSETSFYIFEARKIDISSTEIRERIKEGRSIKYLVLPEIERYIKENRLYL
ncbi:MAG TPA: nicotinate (nicotinamide) nucleotide adenylyltransferase, partial [Hydrogenothermaceae bacterium]|nr:nicotinate (nicotinamide) nucleotide adenylyltransferase [Hydrogenothermaceae bacterium]